MDEEQVIWVKAGVNGRETAANRPLLSTFDPSSIPARIAVLVRFNRGFDGPEPGAEAGNHVEREDR